MSPTQQTDELIASHVRSTRERPTHLVENEALTLERCLVAIQEPQPGMAKGPAKEHPEYDESHKLAHTPIAIASQQQTESQPCEASECYCTLHRVPAHTFL